MSSQVQRALSIRGESVERVYNFVTQRQFIVHRRYQRKLVWTIEEKQSFIGSLLNGYPVPIILLAEAPYEGQKRYEIIDGMQRLNAIVSFIEGHFPANNRYFDLDAMASTKEAVDSKRLQQQQPKLDRLVCTHFASYQIPLSVYEFTDPDEVDEVFRRINAYGQYLSHQELRQAGATGNFAELVRRLAAKIRGDVTAKDQFYRPSIKSTQRNRYEEIEEAVLKHNPDVITNQYLAVHDELRDLLSHAGKPFNQLMFEGAGVRVPRYFETVFLALWELLVNRNMKIANRSQLVMSLDGIGRKIVNVGGGGGRWSAAERQRNVNAVVGVIQLFFAPRDRDDPALDSWVTEFENILRQSYTEQDLYDFKQGLHDLTSPHGFNDALVRKCGKTLCAMVNKGPGSVGYILIGVTDEKETAEQVEQVYGIKAVTFDSFWITGIEHEAQRFHTNLDRYFQRIIETLKMLPVPSWVQDGMTREIRMVRYFEKSVLVMKLKAGREPAYFNKDHFERHGPNNVVVNPNDMASLFARFQKAAGAS